MSTSASKNALTRSAFKHGLVRGLQLVCIFIIIIFGISVYGKYFYTISDGSRTGQLLKFTHNDNWAKTFEGELLVSKETGSKEIQREPEKFYFSVSDKAIAGKLDTIQGQTITVHFNRKNAALYWYGKTEYWVDRVNHTP